MKKILAVALMVLISSCAMRKKVSHEYQKSPCACLKPEIQNFETI